MDFLTEAWNTKWERKKKRIVGRNFNVSDVINLQCEERAKATSRYMEAVRLKSCEIYNTSRINADSMEPSVPILTCKFCQIPSLSNIVAAADEDGFLSLHDMNVGNTLSVIQAHDNAVFDVAWMPGEKKILTMCGDNTARLWDMGEAGFTEISTFVGHSKSVKTADFMPGDPATFATGGRDGNILLWDSRASPKGPNSTFQPDQSIQYAAGFVEHRRKATKYGFANSVTGLAFQDKNSLLSCGSTDRFIRVWDMRRTYCSWKLNEPKKVFRTRKPGFTDLKLNPERTKLYASAIHSSISCFNLNSSSCDPIAEFAGHDASTFYVKTSLSPDGLYLASGSMDKCVVVWKTNSAELESSPRRPLFHLAGHLSEVTGVDFSLSGRTLLVSCGDDGTIRAWRPTATLLDEMGRELADLCLDDKSSRQSTNSLPDSTSGTPSEVCNSNTEPILSKKRKSTDDTLSISESSVIRYRRAVRTDEINRSKAKRRLSDSSPIKISPSKRLILSPSKVNPEYRSPTFNLPNYVLEGSGPSHSCPRLRHKENRDWLTEIQQRPTLKRPATTEKCSKRPRLQPGRCSSRKTLLQYYKKTSKGTDDSSQKT